MSNASGSDPLDRAPDDSRPTPSLFLDAQESPPRNPPPPRKSPVQTLFENRMAEYLGRITEEDRASVARMASPDFGSHAVRLTPQLGAVIISEYNSHNRDIQFGKVKFLADAMTRGEWKWNHQGIAFYDGGELADGQHRCMACILSGETIPIQVTSNLPKDAIDTVDTQAARNAGDACKLLGITDPKMKARVMETVAEYEIDMRNPRGPASRLTVPQIEQLVVENDEQLDQAIALARLIVAKVATPCQPEVEMATCALGMLRGGYPPTKISQFMLNVNMGIGDYPECPTTELARIYERANTSESRKNRLTRRQRLALFFKGAALFVQKKSVSRLKWDGSKEGLPPLSVPLTLPLAAE